MQQHLFLNKTDDIKVLKSIEEQTISRLEATPEDIFRGASRSFYSYHSFNY